MSLTKPVDTSVAFDASEEKATVASTDQVLVERVQSGDVAAFDVLVRKYRERLYGIIYNFTIIRVNNTYCLFDSSYATILNNTICNTNETYTFTFLY